MLKRIKVEFDGHAHTLAGLLEKPDFTPKAYVLFAHCFTCGKDIPAASRISKALVKHGFAVLRFDFTGLGGSDGDFSNSNFSSNVEDLIAAADFLRQSHRAPSILIGHSLGGAAVLKAAADIPEAQAVVSLAAPASAKHIEGLFTCSIETIQEQGEAQVNLAGREFTIKKQFIDDLTEQDTQHISHLKQALLIMHSPLDEIVSIKEAEKIYTLAKHPKSFVSLDTADHLLTRKQDSDYAAGIISAWSDKFISTHIAQTPPKRKIAKGVVEVKEIDHKFLCDIQTDSHQWVADEPLDVNGKNLGPDPYEHLSAALGACTVMTIRMYASQKKIPLENTKVKLSHTREYNRDCENCSKSESAMTVINRTINFYGDLTDDEKNRLMVIADKCPVHKTLKNRIEIRTQLKE